MSASTLIFGAGWFGTQFEARVPGSVLTRADIADEDQVNAELDRIEPDRVINAAGKTGTPNVDACERDPAGTYRSNVAGAILLATACTKRGIHLTHLGSGCVYNGDNDGNGFGEEDPPNFFGSVYSRSKSISEAALRDFGVLQLRMRMPISASPHPRNLLTKLLTFDTVFGTPNSVTVIEDFWRPALALIDRGETGVWNLVNDGAQTHDMLFELYRERVDPTIRFDVVSPEALQEKLVAGRSNCILSTHKLHAADLAMPDVSESLVRVVDAYGAAVRASATT